MNAHKRKSGKRGIRGYRGDGGDKRSLPDVKKKPLRNTG
jgi:hypothetical protein